MGHHVPEHDLRRCVSSVWLIFAATITIKAHRPPTRSLVALLWVPVRTDPTALRGTYRPSHRWPSICAADSV